MDAEQAAAAFQAQFRALEKEIGKVIVGHRQVIEQTLCCLLAGGHVLVEGVPGLGKTLLVRTLADALDLSFSRIQFTPDLMPADIIGTNIVQEDEHGHKQFRFQPGPIFGHIILADEVNRATPKTQSALLEAMAEASVSVSRITHKLPAPFFVLATQNPLEMEGTYPLPEAQLDRFAFKVIVHSPEPEELTTILDRTTGAEVPAARPCADEARVLAMKKLVRQVPVADAVKHYIARLVLATHPNRPEATDTARKYIRWGASPRAGQAMILAAKVLALRAGRFNVSFEDIRATTLAALRHRIILSFEGQAEGISPDDLLRDLVAAVPETIE